MVVHFASLIGYLGGNPNNEASLKKLHEDVERCAANRQPTGEPVNLPTEWPDFTTGFREDFYTTDRYAITYFHTWVYGFLDQSHATKHIWSQCHTPVNSRALPNQPDHKIR